MAPAALVVPLVGLEPVVGAWRRAHTTDGARGMPAHLTLLYPFVDQSEVDRSNDALQRVCSAFEPFDVSFSTLARFLGPPQVLYLEPDRADLFAAITAAVIGEFPTHPPFGGMHDEVIPHLTVAYGSAQVLAEAERNLTPQLPISTRATEVALMEQDATGWWTARCRFGL